MKPKERYFTKTFTRFFVGFLCIIGLAFAIMVGAATFAPAQPTDAIAAPH